MSRHRLNALAQPAVFLLLWAAAPLPADEVPRGPSHEPAPYRYDPAAWRAVPKAFVEDGPACVLYSGTSFAVEPDGTVAQTEHQVTRLNNRRGVELLGEFRGIAYDPSWQKLTLHVARVHKADGRALDVGPQHTHLRDVNTDYQVYDHDKQHLISFPDLAAGDVIEVKWSLRGKDPEGHGQFYGSHAFGQDAYPLVHGELRVLLPRGRTLHSSVRGGTLEPAVQDAEEGRLYHWQVRLRPPLPGDKDLPSKEELRLKVHYSTFATWDEVGAWCQKVRKGCWECTPEVARVAREVTAGLTTEADKARALTYWVRKNVRYLSLHERDTWAPHAPGRVFAARYGDCKDQSQLLAVLLREAGVRAGVAIISWADSGDILESFPSPWGNHAIVLATVDGREAWTDPVMDHAAWDVLIDEDYDRLCFVTDDKGPVRLVRVPPLKPEDNRVEQTTRVRVARDGSARCERELVYRGLAAATEREALLGLSETGRRQHLLQDLQRLHEGAKITRLVIDPASLDDFDEPVRVRVEFEVPAGFAESSPALWDAEVSERLLGNRPTADRKVPLAVSHPCDVKHSFVVDLAPGHRFSDVPQNATVNSAWGRFWRTAVRGSDPRRLSVVSHLVLQKRRVEPAELPAFLTFRKEVQDHYVAWLSRTETADLANAPLLEAELLRSPGDARLALLMAKLYRANDRPAEAARALQSVLERAPDDRLANALLEAASEQEEQAKLGRARAHYQLARSDFERKKFAAALDHLVKAADDAPRFAWTADALDLRGRVCEKLGKGREAAEAFEAMLRLDPGDERALAALVGLALAAKDQAKALGYLRRYAVAVGDSAPGLAAAADHYLRLDRLDEAIDLAARARQAGRLAAAERVAGLVHLRRGDYAKALPHLRATRDLTPDKTRPDGSVLEGLIRAHLGQGDLAAAEALAATAGRVADAPPALEPLCATVAALARRRAALLKEVKAPAGRAADCARAVDRALCAEQAHADGRPAREVEALLAAAQADGVEVGPALALRGLLALERGRLSQALACADRAAELSPNEARGYYVRGRVRLERGDERALADLERAAALGERRDAAVLHWLAAALYEAGRVKEAVAAQREALQRRPGDHEFAEQLRRFEGSQP
jgi:tetratricopeptide (TPR) repeat protein